MPNCRHNRPAPARGLGAACPHHPQQCWQPSRSRGQPAGNPASLCPQGVGRVDCALTGPAIAAVTTSGLASPRARPDHCPLGGWRRSWARRPCRAERSRQGGRRGAMASPSARAVALYLKIPWGVAAELGAPPSRAERSSRGDLRATLALPPVNTSRTPPHYRQARPRASGTPNGPNLQ